MKYSLIALAATALTTGASAAHHRRHNHSNLFTKSEQAAHDSCTCTTYVTTYVVPVTVNPSPNTVDPEHEASAPAPSGEDTTTVCQTNYKTSTTLEYVTATDKAPVPAETTIHSTGVYTIPPNTMTLTTTGYGVVPTEAVLKPGLTTYGGVTTVVKTNTVVTCPVVAIETSDGVTVSKVTQTVYECPSAGTYTIGGIVTSVPATTTVAYGAPTTYPPGTYVQPEVTTTITKTNVVVTCPYTAVQTEKPKEEQSSTYAPGPTKEPEPTEEKPTDEEPTKEQSTSAPEPTKEPVSTKEESTYAPPATSTSSAVSKPSSPAKSPGDRKYTLTYTPFGDNGACKTPDEIISDIEIIAAKGFLNVRLYDAYECNHVVDVVAPVCESHGMGIILGIFIKPGGVDTAKEQLEFLIGWKGWSVVRYLIVGNEAVFNNYCTASELASFIKYVREQLKGIYDGYISTAETLNILQAYGDILCDVIDHVGVNIQAYFDGGVPSDKAGQFLVSQLKLAEEVCKKKAYCWEAGWPAGPVGEHNGVAVASPQDQKNAVLSYQAAAAAEDLYVTFFTYSSTWNPNGIEHYFGCVDLF